MTLTFDFEGQGHKLLLMDEYFSVHVKINSLGTTVCWISYFKCIRFMTLTFDLEGQDHILFLRV